MTSILGISAFYHDSAAALMIDGNVVAAAQEERFTRIRHDPAFPSNAVEYCLGEAAIQHSDVDYVVFYEKPIAKFERLLETYLAFAPEGFRSFAQAIPVWLKEKLYISRTLRSELKSLHNAKFIFTDHHESHAASAFFPSPFDEAAVLTLDGVGEWSTTTYGVGSGNRISLLKQTTFPHSLGLLYSAFTYHCGFRVNSGEYKLMGLAPYGKPTYTDRIREHLIDIKDDGSFWMDMQYFNYCQGLTMTNSSFSQLFNLPVRAPESDITQDYMDMAASVQAVTEEVIKKAAVHLQAVTKKKNLVLAGGVALNCVANGILLREGPFENIWIQPAAGDAGGALGAASFVWHQLLDNKRSPESQDSQKGSLLGPQFSNSQIAEFLEIEAIPHTKANNEQSLVDSVSEMIASNKIVGWFQGRMEYGPRALGTRSILGDPRSSETQSVMNLKIKFRESFRPFAPIVMREHASDWFEIEPNQESPYMLVVAPVRKEKRTRLTREDQTTLAESQDLRERVNISRSEIPAVTHVDYSARLQTVDNQRNPRLHKLLNSFYHRTGCPILVNTSFNVRGEPIVCTPEDAFRCFMATEMDVLVLEDFILLKSEMNKDTVTSPREDHLSQFALD